MSVTLGETAETVYGGIGKDVQLDPKVAGSLRSITWKKGNNKLAEWSPEFEYDYYGRCLTAGRCNLSETTGVLIMKELNPEDTGIYSAEINNKGIPKEFLLTVLVVTLLLIRHFKPEWLEVIGAMIPFCKKPSEPPSMEPVAQNVPNANGQVEQEQQPLLKKNSEDANTQDSSGGALPVNETENAVHDHIAQNQLPADDGITATPEENGEKGVEAPDTTDSQPTAPAATELEGLSPLEKTKQEAIVQDGSQPIC
ncbi:lymphocyte function-associated antigen 3-like isoform X1 [Arapaima gigas]